MCLEVTISYAGIISHRLLDGFALHEHFVVMIINTLITLGQTVTCSIRRKKPYHNTWRNKYDEFTLLEVVDNHVLFKGGRAIFILESSFDHLEQMLI